MKIIGVDNYARETIADVLVCENINEHYGKKVVAMLNMKESTYYYRLVPDEHKLWGGMDELV